MDTHWLASGFHGSIIMLLHGDPSEGPATTKFALERGFVYPQNKSTSRHARGPSLPPIMLGLGHTSNTCKPQCDLDMAPTICFGS